ncbi:hypothetical protein D3C72_2363000 [compost metagenome]
MPVHMRRMAGWAGQALARHVLDQGNGCLLRRAAAQQGNAGLALACAQAGKLRDKDRPFG